MGGRSVSGRPAGPLAAIQFIVLLGCLNNFLIFPFLSILSSIDRFEVERRLFVAFANVLFASFLSSSDVCTLFESASAAYQSLIAYSN
jgi:hypothetical protein